MENFNIIMATGMTNINHIIDVFLASPKFTLYSEFYTYIETTLDYEIAEKCKDWIREVTIAYSKVVDKLAYVDSVVRNNKGFERKEQALEFQRNFTDWRLPIAFAKLDGREVTDKMIRRGIENELG